MRTVHVELLIIPRVLSVRTVGVSIYESGSPAELHYALSHIWALQHSHTKRFVKVHEHSYGLDNHMRAHGWEDRSATLGLTVQRVAHLSPMGRHDYRPTGKQKTIWITWMFAEELFEMTQITFACLEKWIPQAVGIICARGHTTSKSSVVVLK